MSETYLLIIMGWTVLMFFLIGQIWKWFMKTQERIERKLDRMVEALERLAEARSS